MTPSQAAPARGFTFVELIAALAVIAILVSLAWPSYREQVARGRRSEVQAALLEDAQYMQRFYAANNAFDAGPPSASLPVAATPRDASTRAYTLSIAAVTATTFTLVATRNNPGPMATDSCGDFTLGHDGTRGVLHGASGATVETCWR